MTIRPVPAKLTAVEGLLSAILSAAGHAEQLTTPVGAHLTLEHHEAYLRATAPCVARGVRRHLDDLQPVEDVTCHMIPGEYECTDTAACRRAEQAEDEYRDQAETASALADAAAEAEQTWDSTGGEGW